MAIRGSGFSGTVVGFPGFGAGRAGSGMTVRGAGSSGFGIGLTGVRGTLPCCSGRYAGLPVCFRDFGSPS
ncbi:MAG: hypothetical protein J6W82_07125 [Bacteroidales bacterium]|nr:hypothetical protein [Bacteroidales bacterium]